MHRLSLIADNTNNRMRQLREEWTREQAESQSHDKKVSHDDGPAKDTDHDNEPGPNSDGKEARKKQFKADRNNAAQEKSEQAHEH